MWRQDETLTVAVAACDLRVVDGTWAFAERHAADIDAHWQRRTAETPGFFNGIVHILHGYTIDTQARTLRGTFLRTDFKSFLYWRETGWRDPTVMDAFGSGLILSADGAVLLGRQRAGQLNSGLSYLPGGFIDGRDVGADGRIDIAQSVRREVAEETGLDTGGMARTDGYLVATAGPLLSIAVGWRSDLDARTLAERVRRHIASDPEGELADVILLAPGAALPAEVTVPGTVRALLDFLASSKSGV